MLPVETSVAIAGQTNTTQPNNQSALNTQAGYTNLMAEETPTGETYFAVQSEVEDLGYSPTTQAVNDVLHQEEQDRMIEALPEVLLDPQLSDEQKKQMVEMATDPKRTENTLAYQYARDGLETPEPSASNEYITNKELALRSLQTIVDYNLALDASIDQDEAEHNENFLTEARDFITLMIPFWETETAAALEESLLGDDASTARAFFLLGESKQAFRDAFTKMSLEQRQEAIGPLFRALDAATSNQFMTNEMERRGLRDAILYGDYEDWERYLDNVVSLLDASIIGKPVVWGAKGVKRVAKARKVVDQARNGAAHRMAQETNATAARQQISEMIKDETGEVAEALTGTSQAEAVIPTVAPKPSVGGIGLRNYVGNSLGTYEKAIITDPVLRELVDDSAISVLTKKELEAANARVVERLQEAKGVTSRKEMFSVESTDLGGVVRGVYGPKEGGWKSAKEAKELMSIALRPQGISPDEITILKRGKDGQYKPVLTDGKIDAQRPDIPESETGEYLASIAHNYEANFSDIMNNWSQFDVKRNFLDRNPTAAKWKVNRHLFDPASSLDAHITKRASAAVDQAARVTTLMQTNAKKFSDLLGKMPTDRQQSVLKYIEEANEGDGLPFNESMIKAEWNFSDSEMDALRAFRSYWDDEWAISNRTEVRRMVSEGYAILEDAANNNRIFGKPRANEFLDKNRQVFRPDTDDINSYEDIKEFLDKGTHEIIQMRRPLEYDGIVTDYVLVKKNEIRPVTKSDIAFPYRHGYYKVSYNQPHFIIKTVTQGKRTYTQAVATAETVEDAEVYLKRLIDDNKDAKVTYSRRGDIKDRSELAGFEADMFETYGQGRQRVRGKKLIDATAVVQNTEQSNIKGPVDTMIETSRVVGNRVAMTDYMNATKQRFMQTYSDVLKKDRFGQPEFPSRLEDIGDAADADTARVADARTTFEYIAYLEHGYVNGMSEVSKSAMRSVADWLGVRGFGRLEKIARWSSEGSASDAAKNAAFQMYIALNPLRQAVLNAHQSVLLSANFGKYTLNPKGMPVDFMAMVDMSISGGKNVDKIAKMTNRSADELREMYRQLQKSGMLDSIDQNNMVRGTLVDFTEATKLNQKPGLRQASAGLTGVRKVGFDSGEYVNLVTSWLAHYDAAKTAKKGQALTKTDYLDIQGSARNYTFNMNRAGDMPYNQNSLGLIFQFFQVPHKALLGMTTNRGLSRTERARVGAYNACAFTLPATAMYTWFGDILPDPVEHPELHQAVVQGLEFYAFNKAAQGMTGLDVDIDFSSLAPSDPYGVYEVIHAILVDTTLGNILAASPAGGLFFGNNPRVTNLAKTAARAFTSDDSELSDPITAGNVFQDIAHLSSGWSNGYRAYQALRYEKLYSASGGVVDSKVSTPEAIAQLFGFPTMDAAREYALNNEMYTSNKAIRDDVNAAFHEMGRILNRQGITADEIDYSLKMQGALFSQFEGNQFAQQLIQSKLKRIVEKEGGYLHNAILKVAGEQGPDAVSDFLTTLPNSDPVKNQQLRDAVQYMREYDINGEVK